MFVVREFWGNYEHLPAVFDDYDAAYSCLERRYNAEKNKFEKFNRNKTLKEDCPPSRETGTAVFRSRRKDMWHSLRWRIEEMDDSAFSKVMAEYDRNEELRMSR